jgi:hypothetical protein
MGVAACTDQAGCSLSSAPAFSAVGDAVVSDGYLQALKTSAGVPTSGDCNSDTEYGRVIIDTSNERLYVCNGASRGWDYITLTN